MTSLVPTFQLRQSPTARPNRFALGAVFAASVLLLGAAANSAVAQLTAKQLLATSVSDYGPQYREVEAAIAAFNRGNFRDSRRLLQLAVQKQPQIPPADVLQARLFLAANRRQDAVDSLELAVAADRDDPEAYLLMSELALRSRQVTLAELALAKAAALVEKYNRNKRRKQDLTVRVHAGQATVSQLRGQHDRTLEHAKAWAAAYPQSAQPHRLMARAYFNQKKYTECFNELKEVARLDENSPRAEIALALLYEDAGFRDVAKETMALAEKNGADEFKTRLAIADWALNAGLVDLAAKNAAAAAKLEPDSLAPVLLQGRIARQQGDTKKAEQLLQQAAIRAPANFAVTNQLALVLAESPEPEQQQRGLQYAQLNIRAHADRNTAAGREAAVTYAWLLFLLGREADAEKTLQAAINAGSISSESAYYVAKILEQRGKAEIAAQILGPVLKMDRPFPRQDEAQALLDRLVPADSRESE